MSLAIVKILDRIRREGGLRSKDVAQLADVSEMTVSRWVNGHRLPEARTQNELASLRYVVDRLAEIYSPVQVRSWLISQDLIADGKRPIDLVFAGQVEYVLGLIDQLPDPSTGSSLDD